MKWFQHRTDSYSNIKLQEFMAEFGVEGYGVFWIACELVGQQGESYSITNRKNWKKVLSALTRIDIGKVENMLGVMASLNLIDKKALKRNILSIPKMADYSDDYTKRVRRVYEHPTDNVRQDKIRLDKTTLLPEQSSDTKKKL